MIKPARLKPGDRIAAVSLSWGGPATYPQRYQIGKRQFEAEFGLKVIEMPHALRSAEWLADNPQARAEDLMQAVTDDSIQGIICTIGGDDSIRTLPFIDIGELSKNPKPFIGYSDATTTHMAYQKAGVVSYYGPALMAGLAENGGMHRYLVNSMRSVLFSSDPPGIINPNMDGWTVEFLDWGVAEHQDQPRALKPAQPWRWLQGTGVTRGRLMGGCFEAWEWFRGTDYWPAAEQWDEAILFLETSEEGIPANALTRTLRVYAAMGILERLSGILLGRPGGNIDPSTFVAYDEAIIRVIRDEQGLVNLPVITHLDFGHTDPIMTLPIGVMAEIDCERQQLRLVESAVV